MRKDAQHENQGGGKTTSYKDVHAGEITLTALKLVFFHSRYFFYVMLPHFSAFASQL